MTDATETMTDATETTPRGFAGLRCIKCGEGECLSVGLEDLTFKCSSCDDEFDADAVRDYLASWARVLDWIELAPAR